MEDHDTGAGASAVGMSGASPAQSASPQQARFSRHAGAHQRHADPRHAGPKHVGPKHVGQGQTGASQADQHGDQPKGKTRKRRKRKRGRKVFARDENGAVAQPAPAGTTASQPPSPPLQAERRPLQSPPRPSQQELPVFAALDLGTNNCRLLVAVPGRHGQFRVIDAFSRIVRLGEGLTASGRLGQAAMDRAVEALKVCGEKLRNRKIRKARLIATEACRSAANGVEFLDRVEREAGLKLEIIDRQTEARLAVSGCGSLVERDTQGVVLFDIGGGSSEIALIDLTGRRSPRLANHIVSWTSLPVGVVSLAERFGGRTVTRDTFAAMVDDVASRLKAFDGRDRLAHVLASPNFHLLGTSGTVTTLAGVHLDLERYDRRRVDGLWMDRDSVDRMIERLIGWDFQQRCANPCIGADRADLVLAGCAILEAIRGVWPSERLRVADRGLREGILSELMADDGVWRDGGRRA
ncbi:Ppx/GppA family phosphatase [Mesorhizobium sp. M2E.F.Ca.ET.209.01.1.1]|uniref:Ppx/GppA family phosphatase n=1 Tax=Mesorhizobium sp. M2E.F.Ca.ET.209.01.1.1 TaxID=2500526 RepID=UPI000FDBB6E9|nr:Ppx/GppA family phosphatase [Mesorhizobium sp. M2E.F.Ca.ET.209.01.1.1]TGS15083.1 Ppx/GppA family phosphatase [Mesorhizobium sp. M2E.F.Ca.ET.209.01.1.1]